MAYASKDLSVLAYANGFTLWHYTTHDLAAAVATIGYFNGGTDLLRVGDMLLVNCVADGVQTGGVLVVTGNEAQRVTVANIGAPFGAGTPAALAVAA